MGDVQLVPAPHAGPAPASAPSEPAPVSVPDDVGSDGAALLAAADTDADALADRLHDGALQALVVARYAADLAVRGGGDAASVRDAVQQALVALRREVWLLRPRPVGDLQEALHALSSHRVASGGAPLDVDVADGCPADRGLSPAGQALAYRLAQAAALDPGPVRIGLSRSAGTAVLSVTGGAVDPAAWDVRARALGGRAECVAPGRTVRLLLPISADPDPEGAR